jgi:hypothetical protein
MRWKGTGDGPTAEKEGVGKALHAEGDQCIPEENTVLGRQSGVAERRTDDMLNALLEQYGKQLLPQSPRAKQFAPKGSFRTLTAYP